MPAELSPATIRTDAQMDPPDGRKEARKFAKSPLTPLRVSLCVRVSRSGKDVEALGRLYELDFNVGFEKACQQLAILP